MTTADLCIVCVDDLKKKKKMQVNGGHYAKAAVVRVVVAGGCSKYVIIVFPVLGFMLGDLTSRRLLIRLTASRVA